ncbi:ABC transporter ATP-binding protein [Nocardia aurantiaca]|uniref:ATP-binding cassette domain-containing protein n=1 Tax=Nocardia aurantiaca TaxID=2675850 RepID=A0A6I3L901_9NOCA|nr:ABC transporter ATP-binding protein [Nocardia aurantiaca]MTE17254.1 ATP-binding cassette domain-containing protein [Nocardia aurantiaca]
MSSSPDPSAGRTANTVSDGWIRYLLRRCARHRRTAILACAGALTSNLLTAVLPLLVRHVVDMLTTTAASVLPWALALLALGVVRFATGYIRRTGASRLSLDVQHDLRRDLFAALLRLDGRQRSGLYTGQVVSRAITDVTLIQMFLQLLPLVAGNVVLLAASLVLMAWMSPLLSVIALLVVPALWLITSRSQRTLFPANWDAQARAAEVAMRVEAAVAGVRVVKGFGQEGHELEQLAGSARDLYRSRLRITRITSRFTPVMQAVPAAGQTMVLVVGGLLALRHSITLGTFLAFMTYLGSFVTPIRMFSMLLTVSQQGRASLDRVREVIETPTSSIATTVHSSTGTGAVPAGASATKTPAAPRIEFQGVRFAFEDQPPVLDGLDLTVEPGETLAVAGATGSGKSILVHLLPRLYDPDAGRILLNGEDIRELAGLREHIAMVFEDTALMADTVRANVAYGCPGADDEKVWHALRLAAADEFVRALPAGLDTVIGERGQRLSGGQRQRLALARALITDAPVLVLDDATSAIDAQVEEQIFARIAAEVRRRTTIVVAHRISTLALADRVAVLGNGRVAELGTLHELQSSGELFHALFTPPDPASIAADLGAVTDTVPTAGLWVDTDDDGDESRTLEQMAKAFSQRAAGSPGAMGGAMGGGMMSSAPPSGDVQALIDRLPTATGEPEVPEHFSHTPDPRFDLPRLLRPFALPLFAGLGLVALDAAAQILIPFLVRYGIDRGVLAGARDVLLLAAGSALILVVVDWAITVAQVRVSGRAGERLLYGLRVKVFAQLQRLGLQFYERELAGRIMTRMITDVDGLSTFLQTGLAVALTSTLTISGVVVALVVIDARLALVVLALLPVLVISTIAFRRAAVPSYNLAREQVSATNAYLQENVDTIAVIQAYCREAVNQREFERRSWAYRNARLRSQTLMALFFPFIEIMSLVATVAVLAVGVHQVRENALTAGTLIAFLLYIDLLFAPIQQLSQVFDSYQQAVIGVERLGVLMREPVTTPEAFEARSLNRIDGEIEFRGVGFAYDRDTPHVLSGIDLRIAAGQKVAVVGETGAGKSTLVKLLARLYDTTDGAVLVDGVDIRDYRLRDYRKRLGVVPQEPFLFGDTVHAAIAYGKPDATPAEIEWAARAVGAHEMIAALDHGYRQPIGAHGAALSAGQRQLLALARAQLVDPDILILDEATASLDLDTDARVRAAVDVLTTGRTTIVVAHRLSTAADADLIAVLGHGRLLQIGRHAELLETEGPYRELWAAYVGTAAESEPMNACSRAVTWGISTHRDGSAPTAAMTT